MTRAHHWTPDELTLLQAQYPHQVTRDIAQALGLRIELVYARASRMGLRKSAAFAASDKSGRVFKGGLLGQQSQFKSGQQPWNKGTSYKPGGRCAQTQFKKGHLTGAAAHNYVPIGSTRVSADGHLERKITDDPALYPARRWSPVSRLVWEAAHGPIPPKHIIVFKPGMKTAKEADITPDRLDCISRKENARRNHPRLHSPELGRLTQLKGAITRQVNRIIREAQAATP